MDYPDELLCLFTAQVEERNGSYVVEVPEREVSLGDVRTGSVYRVALLSEAETGGESTTRQVSEPDDGPQEPPVDEGERRTVEIEDIGDQGDGVARVERGYVIIVPDTELNERVTVRITEVRENLAFGEVIKRHDHVE
jgi:predicted RNA-binding protein with TRAM domain